MNLRHLVFVAALVSVPAGALAKSQAPSPSAELRKQAAAANDAGHPDEAAKLFGQAYSVDPDPTLLFDQAQAYEKANDLDDAIATYKKFLDAKGTNPDQVKQAALSMSALQAKQSQAAADKQKAALQQAEDEKQEAELQREAEITSAQQEKAALVQKIQTQQQPSRPSLVPGVVVLGVGAGAVALGAVFGIQSNDKVSEFNSTFDRTQRPQLRDQAQSRAHAADACFAVGAVAGGVGTFLLIRALTDSPPPASTPTAVLLDRGAAVAWSGSW